MSQDQDRLELYALYQQATRGDAPVAFRTDSVGAIKERYEAWKTKRGWTADKAMADYAAECDRQVLAYGTSASSMPQAANSNPLKNSQTVKSTQIPVSSQRSTDVSDLLCCLQQSFEIVHSVCGEE